MLIIVPLIILMASWFVKGECPPSKKILPFCTCREKYTGAEMTCSNLQSDEDLISPVQATVQDDMFSIKIVNSSLQYIPTGLFQETNYKEIYLIGTELISLSDSDVAFDGLEDTLTAIFIKEAHYVDEWEWSQLKNLRRLQLIDIDYSSIYSVDQVFLAPHLKSLSITDSKVSSIHDYAFEALKELEYLYLQGNSITVLKRSMFSKPSQLRMIRLNRNQLRHLPEDLFEYMPNLRALELNMNQFTILNEKEFSLAMKQLYVLSMTDNPLRCDCRLRWIVKSKKPRSFEARCTLPKNLNRVPLQELHINQLWC
ncbi:Slit-like protein, partial [Stegodyphus mimosarum]